MLFEDLFYNVKSINMFDDKNKYKLYNFANYKGLFDEEKEIITWYYDETAHEVANILKIMKKEDRFIIEFSIQPYVGKYDEDVHTPNNTPVRFRNSGSRYSSFNLLFMKMYLNMNELDEFNSYYH